MRALPGTFPRHKLVHELFAGADGGLGEGLSAHGSIARLQQLLKLRDLLGLSLDAIIELAEAEEARAALRDTWESDEHDGDMLQILDQAHPLILRQLELVRERQRTLARFARELRTVLRTIEKRCAAPASARGQKLNIWEDLGQFFSSFPAVPGGRFDMKSYPGKVLQRYPQGMASIVAT
ncbi:MAG: hypothetical protein M3Q31_25745 [Actinomycetota bacterium]|nr:hypothetical protein [Actinomycetota bacterium]